MINTRCAMCTEVTSSCPLSCFPRVDDNAVISPSECKLLLMECHEVMCAACDLIHARCAKILAIRAKVMMS